MIPTRRPLRPAVVALAIVTVCAVDWPRLILAAGPIVAQAFAYALAGAGIVATAALAVVWGALFYLRPDDHD